jgi:5'-nucleotidase
VNRVVAEIDDQVDVIVAQYHEGTELGDSTATLEQALADGGVFERIVNDTDPAVDAIFTGHTHAKYAWEAPVPGEERTRPILQTGSYGENIGQIVLTVDEAGDVVDYTVRNVPRLAAVKPETSDELDARLIATYPRVKEVSDIVTAARAEADVVGRVPVGSVTADITTAFQEGGYVDGVYAGGKRDDRSKPSALGGLVADALLWKLSDPTLGGADLAVVNPGGLRDELLYGEDGVITVAEANAVLPFVNNLWTTTLTGDQLRLMLEQQWGDASGRGTTNLALGVSENVRYTYDASRPAGQRVSGIWVDGAPVDPAAEYRVGSFSFLLQGGDSFSVFRDGTDTRDSGLIDRDGWFDYLRKNPGLTPDFTARAVQVSGVPDQVERGGSVTFAVSNLDLTSLGAPAHTSLSATLGDGPAVETAVVGGAATVRLAIPAGAPDTLEVALTAQPTGTQVTVPLRVGEAGAGAGTGSGTGAETDTSTPRDGALAVTGTDGAWMGAGVLAALALLGLGVVVRRRSVRQTD